MTTEEFEETLNAAMRAYEAARSDAQPMQPVTVEVRPVPVSPPALQTAIFCTALFLAGLCLGLLIGGRRK